MHAEGLPLLSAHDLSRKFGEFRALEGASFSVHSGEVLGLIGPNGAGKTTLFQCLAGVAPATRGEVHINGAAVTPESRKRHLFYLPDGMRPWGDQPVQWALDFVRHVYGGNASIDTSIVDALGIRRLLRSRLRTLSKGEHKRVMLALALQTAQPLLLLDEPFDGLDLRQTREVMVLLREQVARGRTLFLSIHQLADAARVCDRFVLLSAGRIVAEGTLAELRTCAGLDAQTAPLDEIFLALT